MPTTHLAYTNPPPDVQVAVAAVKDACATWHPTEVPNLPHVLPPAPQYQAITEAQVCSYIKDPDAVLWGAASMALIIVLIIAVFIWAIRPHRLLGMLFRRRNRGAA
jgi:hypothetical protein